MLGGGGGEGGGGGQGLTETERVVAVNNWILMSCQPTQGHLRTVKFTS